MHEFKGKTYCIGRCKATDIVIEYHNNIKKLLLEDLNKVRTEVFYCGDIL